MKMIFRLPVPKSILTLGQERRGLLPEGCYCTCEVHTPPQNPIIAGCGQCNNEVWTTYKVTIVNGGVANFFNGTYQLDHIIGCVHAWGNYEEEVIPYVYSSAVGDIFGEYRRVDFVGADVYGRAYYRADNVDGDCLSPIVLNLHSVTFGDWPETVLLEKF